LVKEYDGKVRVVYKNFVVHPDTVMEAHLAGCAANEQGKFKEFSDAFWDKGFGAYSQTRDPSTMSGENLMKIAAGAGLDRKRLQADLNSDKCKAQIQGDMAELNKFGVGGTPSFFVNGKFTMFSNPQAFKQMIDAELAAVGSSGVPADQYYAKVVMEQGLKKFRSKKDAADAKKGK
jgi:protein-disulfide isomerase